MRKLKKAKAKAVKQNSWVVALGQFMGAKWFEADIRGYVSAASATELLSLNVFLINKI